MAQCEGESMLRKESTSPRAPRMTARQSRQLSRIEEELQTIISRDDVKPKSKLSRIRKRGAKILHTKAVLLLIVLLNSLDCVLVLSELVLDVSFVRDMINTAENTMETFNFILKEKYPEKFKDVPIYDTYIFYNGVLEADLVWAANNTVPTYCSVRENNVTRVKRSSKGSSHVVHRVVLSNSFEPSDDPEFLHNDPEFLHDNIDTPEEIISHIFHKASIAILAILVVYILLKVFCAGRAILRKRLELFDGFVVICSFIADIYFIDGLTNYPLESFILMLALAIPWRVIRVLNSLVISVKDKFTFQKKLMYKKNKLQSEKIMKLKFDREQKQGTIDSLLRLCKKYGIPNGEIYDLMDNPAKGTKSKSEKARPQTALFGSCFGLSTRPSENIICDLFEESVNKNLTEM